LNLAVLKALDEGSIEVAAPRKQRPS
jgi:hypothetical protein